MKPILKIPNRAIIEESSFCKSPESKYVVKKYKFRDFNHFDLKSFSKYLDCPGGSGNETTHLELTKISEINNEDLLVLKPAIDNKIICELDSIIPRNHKNILVGGCKGLFSKSVNNKYTEYTAIYFLDLEKYIIYELTYP